MTTSCLICVFLWVYVLQFHDCGDPRQTPNSGPYKLSIASITECTDPSKPYMKKPPVYFGATTNNSTLSGNITYFMDTKNMKIKLKGFILRNGKWEPSVLINNLDCHGMMLHFLCASLGVKYDRKSCTYFKGSYIFENLDVNQLIHLWLSNVQYGHIKWRSETYSQAGTFFCKEYDTLAEPA